MTTPQKNAPRPFCVSLYWMLTVTMAIYSFLGLFPAATGATEEVTLHIGFFLGTAMFMSTLAIIAGIMLKRSPQKLLPFFYRVVMPLSVASIFCLFIDARLTLGVGVFMIILLCAAIYSAARLLSLAPPNSWLSFAGASAQAWCAAWVSLLLLTTSLLLFVLVIFGGFGIVLGGMHVAQTVWSLITLSYRGEFYQFVLWACLVGGILACVLVPPLRKRFTRKMVWIAVGLSAFLLLCVMCSEVYEGPGGLLVAALYSVSILSFVHFSKLYIVDSFTNLAAVSKNVCSGPRKAALARVGALVFVTLLFVIGSHTNHASVLNTATSYTLSETEKMRVIRNAEKHKQALTEIYLAPFLYPLKPSTLDLSLGFLTAALFKPLVYTAGENMQKDQEKAASIYQMRYGVSIDVGEEKRIRQITGRASKPEMTEGSAKKLREPTPVYISSQDISFRDEGEWADIELHEVYRNTDSYRDQKITLLFRLPSGAVVSGLWLSDDEDKKFEALVAPRGAARKTFDAIVRRGQDPALVEEIGPNTYRLEVFPIPGLRGNSEPGDPMHVWLRIRSVKQNDVEWKLPTLIGKKGVRWDCDTAFSVNGVQMPRSEQIAPQADAGASAWLPESLPVASSTFPERRTIALAGHSVLMEPRKDVRLVAPGPLAVFVDTSGDMQEKQEKILQAIALLGAQWEGPVTPYVWRDGWQPVQGALEDTLAKHIFWGDLTAQELAKENIPAEAQGAASIVLTKNARAITLPRGMNGALPFPIAVDASDTALEPNGTLEADIYQALCHMREIEARRIDPDIAALDERYVWRVKQEESHKGKTESPYMPQAVHALVTYLARDMKNTDSVVTDMSSADSEGGAAQLGITLDTLQTIAVQGHVVTPYSSMIALVSDWQKELLKKAEQEQDRFSHKEQEDVRQGRVPTKSSGSSKFLPNVAPTAVPEPEEWALIIVGSCILMRHLYRRRNALCFSAPYVRFR